MLTQQRYIYGSLYPIFILVLVGVTTQNNDHLKFLFEMNEDFCVLPSFGVIPLFRSNISMVSNTPGLDIDPTKVS